MPNESVPAKKQRLERAKRRAAVRNIETQEERQQRLEQQVQRQAASREAQTQEQRQQRLAENARREAARRNSETEAQVEDRRERDRIRHRNVRRRQRLSKKDYLDDFNASIHGNLHEQQFVHKHMKDFHDEINKFNLLHCIHCKELWPAKERININYSCSRCRKENNFHKFGPENDMTRDMSSIPSEIQIHLRKLKPIEEMLLSPVLSIMSIYRLISGENVSRGFVANFKQDTEKFIREIPLLPSQLPCIIVRRRGESYRSKDFKICRKRVEEVGRFLIQRHPGFNSNGITFSQSNCNLLPEDGILDGIVEIEVDENQDLSAFDEGPNVRDDHIASNDENDDAPPDQAFVIRNDVRPPQKNEILNALDPVAWPNVFPDPINEFQFTSGLASLAFVKLFPLGQADPTRKGRIEDISELAASHHLLKYGEVDCVASIDGNSVLYYPFGEHDRFSFWMADRIQRHRALAQCKVFLRQHSEEASLTMDELETMARNGDIDSVISKMYSYTANITGTNAYWAKRGRELEAVMQQKNLGTAFFTYSYADNHWTDLHRLMPNGLLEPKFRYRNTNSNPHLADWYFSEKLKIFIKHFFAGVLDHEWIWYRYEWQSRTAIHAHGVVKLKNDPGISDLVVKTYAGKLMAENLENEDYIGSRQEDELVNCQKIVDEGIQAEKKVLSYVDTLLTGMNTRTDPINPIHAAVPDPHPCSKNILSLLNDANEMDKDYEELANCVQPSEWILQVKERKDTVSFQLSICQSV